MFSTILFACFAVVLLLAAMMAVFSKQTMHSVLWLALVFFSAAGLWIGLDAEFLGITLVLVYVGAVMTLFLFVVMTLPDQAAIHTHQKKSIGYYSLPIALACSGCGLIYYAISSSWHTVASQYVTHPASNIAQSMGSASVLGQQLYTQYVYPFELIGVLLLVTIIVCIRLTHVASNVHEQPMAPEEGLLAIKRADRIQLVKDK